MRLTLAIAIAWKEFYFLYYMIYLLFFTVFIYYTTRAVLRYSTPPYPSTLVTYAGRIVIVALLVIVLVEAKEGIRDSGHLHDEFEDMERRLLQRLRQRQ
jgi:nitric oxide reductase large subunit